MTGNRATWIVFGVLIGGALSYFGEVLHCALLARKERRGSEK